MTRREENEEGRAVQRSDIENTKSSKGKGIPIEKTSWHAMSFYDFEYRSRRCPSHPKFSSVSSLKFLSTHTPYCERLREGKSDRTPSPLLFRRLSINHNHSFNDGGENFAYARPLSYNAQALRSRGLAHYSTPVTYCVSDFPSPRRQRTHVWVRGVRDYLDRWWQGWMRCQKGIIVIIRVVGICSRLMYGRAGIRLLCQVAWPRKQRRMPLSSRC